MERNPEVPASPRDEAPFHYTKPSGVPRGPATSTGSLASQRHPGIKICKKTDNLERIKDENKLFPNFRTIIQTAAAAKSLQSCPALCDPTDGSPPGSSVPGLFQARHPHDSTLGESSREAQSGRLLGESQGRGSLVGCRLWGRTELDTTEVT